MKPKKNTATKRKRIYRREEEIQTTVYLCFKGKRYCVTASNEFDEGNRYVLHLKAIAYKELPF
jgi:hypothetical protein